MAIFSSDNKQFQIFIEDVNGIIERLSAKAEKRDVAVLDKLIENFKIKTEDFYRENRKLNIGVVGQVKAGKSSFLNTMLFGGKEILPKASTPKTATLTKMEYSERNIIQVEYYAVEEWEVLEDNAAIDLDDEIYTSAREIVEMVRRNGIDPLPYLEKGHEEIEFASYDDLIANLNTYVGEDGKFTPIVKAVTLYLNKEEFLGLSIVDTPGLNDPIASRTIRTKEFMEVCDVVFFLSQSGSFLDKSDWILLSSQLPQKGVKKLVLVASKYDSGIRDILRLKKEDDDFDDFGEDENIADNIPKACKIIKKKLRKRAKQKVEEFVNDLIVRGSTAELRSVIEQCAEPILVSAMACNMAKKSTAEYSAEEQNVYNALKIFSKDMKSDLNLLGNFDEINTIFNEVVAKKEAILAEKAKSFIPTAKAEVCASLEGFKEKTEQRLAVLEQNDREQLLEQKKLFERQINNIRADVVSVFGELNTKIELEKKEAINALREISKDYTEVKERIGEKVHRETRTVSDSKWYKPWSWGDSHEEHSIWTEHYSYCVAADAIDNLRNYTMEAAGRTEQVFTDAVELKALKRKLLDVVIQNFDMGSEKYDSALFRILVEQTLSKIELPIFNLDATEAMGGIAAKFKGELTTAQQQTDLKVALAGALSKIYDELCNKLLVAVSEFKKEMQAIADVVQDGLLENINKEFEILLAQYENKEKEIDGYKVYVNLIEQEIERL